MNRDLDPYLTLADVWAERPDALADPAEGTDHPAQRAQITRPRGHRSPGPEGMDHPFVFPSRLTG